VPVVEAVVPVAVEIIKPRAAEAVEVLWFGVFMTLMLYPPL
jgi:hypothetical protein